MGLISMWLVRYKAKTDTNWATFISNTALMNFAAQDFIDYWFKQHDKTPPQVKDFHEARKVMWNEGVDFYITL